MVEPEEMAITVLYRHICDMIDIAVSVYSVIPEDWSSGSRREGHYSAI
jgi:hypothetical protein